MDAESRRKLLGYCSTRVILPEMAPALQVSAALSPVNVRDGLFIVYRRCFLRVPTRPARLYDKRCHTPVLRGGDYGSPDGCFHTTSF